jgi:hypothetical protein
MSPLEPCCYRCVGGCDQTICRDNAPSPTEDQHKCADCDYSDQLRHAIETAHEQTADEWWHRSSRWSA